MLAEGKMLQETEAEFVGFKDCREKMIQGSLADYIGLRHCISHSLSSSVHALVSQNRKKVKGKLTEYLWI